MAATDFNRSASGSASVANRVSNYFSNLVGTFVAWNEARVTRSSLNALSDRELEDIGLTRGDINDVAARKF